MWNINLAPSRRQKPSRRLLILVCLFCLVFGSLVLTAVLFINPEAKRPQLVGERIRLPITSNKKEGKPRIPGIVEEEGIEEKPLQGGILEGKKPIVSEPPRPSMVIQDGGPSEKVSILGEKEAPKEEKEVVVAEGEAKIPGIEGKEGDKNQVTMAEEPKGLAIPEGKLPTGRYTLNIASFRDKGNADRLVRELEEKGYEAFVEKASIPQKGTWYRVAVGRFSSRGEALTFAQGLKEKGIRYSFVRKLKEVKQ